MLSDIAISDSKSFKKIVEIAIAKYLVVSYSNIHLENYLIPVPIIQ